MVMAKTRKRSNQQGIVSITVTIVLMIVITLIVLTFAKIVRREQRQALDRQLSTQAFYAAESGINNVVSAIKGGYNGSIDSCSGTAASGNATNDNKINTKTVNSAANVSIPCITINQSPNNLYYSSVDQTSTVVPLTSGDGSAFTSLTLKWQAKTTNVNPKTNCNISKNFPANGIWNCPVGIIRVDLVPTAGSLSRTTLNTSMLSAFLYPSGDGSGESTFGYNEASGTTYQGAVIKTKCDGSPVVCTMTIASGLGSNQYVMRVRSLYVPSTLTVTATNAAGPTSLANAQAIVDSTGKASDVLRRIQVRVPLSGAGNVPDFGIQTNTDICKRYMYIPGQNVMIDPLVANDPGNPCGIN